MRVGTKYEAGIYYINLQKKLKINKQVYRFKLHLRVVLFNFKLVQASVKNLNFSWNSHKISNSCRENLT